MTRTDKGRSVVGDDVPRPQIAESYTLRLDLYHPTMQGRIEDRGVPLYPPLNTI